METKDYIELDLRQILAILRKRLWMIILITLGATLISALASYFYITPIYEASTQLLVNKSERDPETLYSLNDINTDLKLIDTYRVIIKSPRIMDLVIQNLHLDMTLNALSAKVKVSTVQNSKVMSITVSDPNPAEAVRIANGIADVFKQEIINIMNVDNVQILTTAKLAENPVPVKPKPILNMFIAFAAGLMASFGLVFLLEYLDTSIRSEKDVEQILGLPVLGSIPTIELASRKAGRKKAAKAKDLSSENIAAMETAAGSDQYETT